MGIDGLVKQFFVYQIENLYICKFYMHLAQMIFF